jgi:hypothetical protein
VSEYKPHYLPPLAFYELDRACAVINGAFDGYGCYLVGSAGERRDFRDVDVRFIMRNEAFEAMFPDGGERRDQYWSLLSVAISAWLSKQTGYSVDFQIQKMAHANTKHQDGRRNALGIRVEYPGEEPRYQGAPVVVAPSPDMSDDSTNYAENRPSTPEVTRADCGKCGKWTEHPAYCPACGINYCGRCVDEWQCPKCGACVREGVAP